MGLHRDMRIWHRYLGFFLAGIMAIYALSGVVLIFRNTEFLKFETRYEKSISPDTPLADLGNAIGLKGLRITKVVGDSIYFKEGTYDQSTGQAIFTKKELPLILDRMTKMHKATTDSPLFLLNIFFGTSLLFFVISAYWMFLPNTAIFKKAIYFTLGGIALVLIMLLV